MTDPLPDFRSPAFLLGHVRRTLAFYEGRALDPTGGFFHALYDDGRIADRRTRHLVSSTRFVFNHAMAWRRFGRPEDLAATRHALAFVEGAHRQPGGGYAWVLDWDGRRARVVDGTNHAYGLAFVLLAQAHALMAGIGEARAGLEATFALLEARFWEPADGLYADEATADWQLAAYRGQNANMHACEAMLAAAEATGDARYLQRALRLAGSVTQDLASRCGGLVWEHYRHGDDGRWVPDWAFNRHDRVDIFRPWGYQVGHLTEWAKLLLQLEARLNADQRPGWLLPTAVRFAETALRHGWDDAHGGLVYGFAPGGPAADDPPFGTVCDGDKYFWVQAESLAACAGLALRTGEEAWWRWYDRIWAYAWAHFVDHVHGAWFRIRTPDNRAVDDLKSPPGKTDYHTMGACYDVLNLTPYGPAGRSPRGGSAGLGRPGAG